MKWEEWQVEYLKEHYYDGNIDQMAEYIGTTPNALKNKAYKLHLKTNRYLTKEEDAIIRQYYGKIPTCELAEKVGRSKQQIKNYVTKHKIPSGRRWTPEKEAWLEEKYGVFTAQGCAKHLKVSVNAVRSKAQYIGIGQFKENSDLLTCTDVAEMLGVSRSTVIRWAQKGWISSTKKNRYVMINEKDLIKFMKENPDRWKALKCDKYMFQRHQFFVDRLKEERQEMIEKRWGKWL